jgi:glycosyltransferase involved in cell wall biosynthesis
MNISVALCTYNGEKYLAEQLGSILNQTCPVSEIIVCDDLSSDRTIEIINELSLHHKGIIQLHINERNLGGKKNFEKAFGLTTGDIIFFSDQDDVWESSKVECTIKYFGEDPGCLGVFSDASLIDYEGKSINKSFLDSFDYSIQERKNYKKETIHKYILNYCNIVAGSMLAVRKESKNYVLPFQLMDFMWHDEWIVLNLVLMNKLAFINRKLIKYRVHNAQQVGVGNEDLINKLINLKSYSEIKKRNEDALFYFNYRWNLYNKLLLYKIYIPSLEPVLQEFQKLALEAKYILLSKKSFISRKAHLCKWYLKDEYQTSFKDIFVL